MSEKKNNVRQQQQQVPDYYHSNESTEHSSVVKCTHGNPFFLVRFYLREWFFGETDTHRECMRKIQFKVEIGLLLGVRCSCVAVTHALGLEVLPPERTVVKNCSI
jgi:hypothetical protein